MKTPKQQFKNVKIDRTKIAAAPAKPQLVLSSKQGRTKMTPIVGGIPAVGTAQQIRGAKGEC